MVDNRGPQLAAISATFGGMALVTVLLRCFVRSRIVRAFGLDDAFMVVALLVYCWYTASVLGGIHYGTGQHMSTLTTDSTMHALRFWWMCYVSYCATMTLAKISIGLFLLRVTVARLHRWIIMTVLSITVVTGLIFLFVTLFQCTPVEFFWTKVVPGHTGSCFDIDVIINLTYVYGSICAVCDFTFGVLPIFVVWNLNMDRRTKFVLSPILGMACIASSAVIVRMPFIKDFKNPDFLYATVDIAIWSTTEAGLAITAGSLATLRPLYRRLFNQPSARDNPESFEHTPTPHLGSSSKRRRTGIFSISQYTTKGRDDSGFDFDFASPKGAYRLDEEESNHSGPVTGNETRVGYGCGSAGAKKKESWKIHVRNEFSIENSRSDELHLTALPSTRR